MSKKPTSRGVTSSFQTSQKATSLKYPVLHPSSASDHQLKTLKTNLIKWINNLIKPLHVKDITNDMADGQILACLIGIYERDHSSILKLLVNLSHVVGANLNLPSNVSIAVMKSITLDGVQKNKTTINEITADESLFRVEKTDLLDEFDVNDYYADDVFDELVNTPEKLEQVTVLLSEFVNDQLNPIKIQVNNLMEDLENGINLIILTGIVETINQLSLSNSLPIYYDILNKKSNNPNNEEFQPKFNSIFNKLSPENLNSNLTHQLASSLSNLENDKIFKSEIQALINFNNRLKGNLKSGDDENFGYHEEQDISGEDSYLLWDKKKSKKKNFLQKFFWYIKTDMTFRHGVQEKTEYFQDKLEELHSSEVNIDPIKRDLLYCLGGNGYELRYTQMQRKKKVG
ncbi:hypothetical protein HK099_007789 [Clydaea vesicula]|uniref:Calponin-homology (CH) domain-containing protein n=1 Tax=Clydaea vesicula TaxID=447962 RepID=A0AAD5XTF2_9FUNG|nr:hypothetical protein HK099_007789 [Clydaea vesicula]